MSRRLKIIKNFFSLTTAEIVNRVTGLIYLPYIARIFGPEGFGKLNFAESIASYFMLAANFGFDTIGTREVAMYKEKEGEVFVHILAIELLTSLVSFLALCGFVYLVPQPLEIKLLVLFYGFTLITFGFTIDWFFVALERMGIVALVRILRQICYIALILLAIHSPEHLYRLPLSYVAADIAAILMAFYLFFARKGDKKLSYRIQLNAVKYYCREALPLGASNLLNSSRERIGPVLLGFMRNIREVGFYSVGYKLSCVANIIPLMLYRAIFPDMAHYLKNRPADEVRAYMKEIFKVVSLLVFPLSFFIYFNAAFIVNLIFGNDFKNGTVILEIIIWTTALLLISRPYYFYMVAMGRQKRLFTSTLLGLSVNIVLSLYFAKRWGAAGATTAFLVSELILSVVYYFASGIKIAPGRELFSALVYFLPSLALCYLLKGKVHSLVATFLAFLLYALILSKVYDLRSLWKVRVKER